MNPLKLKIKNTLLFDDKKKIDLLVAIDDISTEEQKKFEAIVDDFDKSIMSQARQLKVQLKENLDSLLTNYKDQVPELDTKVDASKKALDEMIPDAD